MKEGLGQYKDEMSKVMFYGVLYQSWNLSLLTTHPVLSSAGSVVFLTVVPSEIVMIFFLVCLLAISQHSYMQFQFQSICVRCPQQMWNFKLICKTMRLLFFIPLRSCPLLRDKKRWQVLTYYFKSVIHIHKHTHKPLTEISKQYFT